MALIYDMLKMISFCITFFGEHISSVRLCWTSTTVTSKHRISLILSGIQTASVSVFWFEQSQIMLRTPLVPDRLIANQYHDFLGTVLPQLLEGAWRCTSSWEAKVCQHNGSSVHFLEDIQQWLNATYRRRTGFWGPNAWPQLPNLTLMEFFLCGTSDAAHLCSPSKTIEDFLERHQAPVTAVDSTILWCVW
jgi:hypothetical protein